jgi:hypothetical protein
METGGKDKLIALDRAIDRGQFELADTILAQLRAFPELTPELDIRAEKMAIFRVPEAPRPPFVYGEDLEEQQEIQGYGMRKLVKIGMGLLMLLAIRVGEWLHPDGKQGSTEEILAIMIVVPVALIALTLIFRWVRRKLRF